MTMNETMIKKLKNADAILVGASNGLSITEGLHLFADNEAFEELFGDLKRKYGLRCLLHGMTARWPSEEEKWGFWSRAAHHYCAEYQPTQVMKDLQAIIGDRDYFIVTSNGECHFEKCGLDPEKIYEIEGNWLTMQCSRPCHDTIYPAAELLEQMAAVEQNGKIPSEMVPHCPKCGAPMQIHDVGDHSFIPNRKEQKRFEDFLAKYHGRNIVILELGIGARNQLIKAPLMRLTASEPNATYITINLGEVYITRDIQDKSYGLDGYLSDILGELRNVCEE
ncbi:MAG: NAD-dependent protein deacetylase, SIR2 family [Lachnospiraceae bacterium]|nr:NAD-dependent protein deacetylase, SIR2 family [Lachnospiraceae bacterium]